jgi:hypothetical protein
MTDQLTPPLDYEAVKEYFYTKLSEDRRGRGRMESAIFHTVQHVFELGCNHNADLVARIAFLTEQIRLKDAKLDHVCAQLAEAGDNDIQRDFIKSLLDPERNGWSVSKEVRAAARGVLQE